MACITLGSKAPGSSLDPSSDGMLVMILWEVSRRPTSFIFAINFHLELPWIIF